MVFGLLAVSVSTTPGYGSGSGGHHDAASSAGAIMVRNEIEIERSSFMVFVARKKAPFWGCSLAQSLAGLLGPNCRNLNAVSATAASSTVSWSPSGIGC